ncbi:MAG: TetR/AcrR family transcriptional regulator, partial [bacterium]|nr:TetR/AcrR family transcriptional regulator [bacterium]
MTGLRERKKQQTRDAIVSEAGRLFTRQGFRATTMEEIAAAADVSIGTLYNYFGTKNTVLLAHLGSQVAEMMEAGAAVLADPPADVVAAVQSLLGGYLERFVDLDRELLREVFAAGFGPSTDILPELIRLDELLFDQIDRLLAPFAAAGELTAGIELEEAVIVLYSLLTT